MVGADIQDRAKVLVYGPVRRAPWGWPARVWPDDTIQTVALDIVEAVAAARVKARDYHCRSAYWAEGRFASGTSGPRYR